MEPKLAYITCNHITPCLRHKTSAVKPNLLWFYLVGLVLYVEGKWHHAVVGRCNFFYGWCAGFSMFAHISPYILPISFILQCVQLRLLYFVQGGHFPAVRDWLRQAPLAETVREQFLAGDTYLRDRCEEKAPRALLL